MIVVDDGSPVAASGEVSSLTLAGPIDLQVIRQDNGGVGMARNRGLRGADPSASLIAFLDSDDEWPDEHLARAIQATEQGYDFYFADNRREGHHESYLRSPYLPMTCAFLDASCQKAGLLEIPVDRMIGLTLREMPCQASTVVYRRSINPALKFNTDLKSSGEDVLFFTALVASAHRVCVDLDSVVECGGGVNIYFSNLSWESKRFLSIMIDHLVMRRLLDQCVTLSGCNREWNDALTDKCRRELAYQMLRQALKNPGWALQEFRRLINLAPRSAALLHFDMGRVAFGQVLRRVHGSGKGGPGQIDGGSDV